MIITEQERKDMVTLFNAQDAAKALKSASIDIGGVSLTCYETGEIEKRHKSTGEIIRTFGTASRDGYLVVRAGTKQPKVHRAIYAAFNGDIEDNMQIDHRDGDKQNNCIENLRELTGQENSRAYRNKKAGSSSKYRGVSWHKRDKRWISQIMVYGKSVTLGYFHSEIDAAKEYDKAAIRFNYPKEALNFQF